MDDEELKNETLSLQKVESQYVQPKFEKTAFAEKMEDVKINVLKEAALNDDKFVETVKTNLKKAAVAQTEIEHDKAQLEKQQVESESKKESKKQQKIENEIKEDKWDNRQKWRKFVFDGVKPILNFVGITDPMNIFLTIVFTVILFVPFLVAKLWNGTIGALLLGACDKDRSKSMKGLIWTILVLVILIALFILVYLFLKSQGIDLLVKLR